MDSLGIDISTVFRERLSKAIVFKETCDLVEDQRQLADQIRQIEDLRPEFQHSISVVKRARISDTSTYKYTCYMYAFDLMDYRMLKAISGGNSRIYPRSEFVIALIRDLLVEIDIASVNDGDLVIYFGKGVPTHAGRWQRGLVMSKWGKYGHLWQHGIGEVPMEHGDCVRFYQKAPNSEVIKNYRRWAESVSAT